jgi:hypothetical protein
MSSKAPKKRSADEVVAPQPRRKAVKANARSGPSASPSPPPSSRLRRATRRDTRRDASIAVVDSAASAAASPSMGPSTDPPAGPALEDLDQLCAKEELDLAASQHLATTRADVDADPDLAAYAEAELERVGQEARQVWNSTRPANTQKAYAKGKRVWYEWCRLHRFRDRPLVRELKFVLWLKEYVLRLTTTHRKHGVNRPSGLLKGEGTVQQHDKAASAGKSLGPCSGRIAA